MKTLFIIRHAKSSWADFNQADFDRPLNQRGKKDATEMARRLAKREIKIDAFVSSPARRAKNTCNIFCEAFEMKEEKIIFADELYQAPEKTFYDVVRSLDDQYKTVAIFSHNTGLTAFVNTLCKNVVLQHVPTCGIFAVESKITEWKHIEEKENQFLFFDYPKSEIAK